jgi:hypothetical protein
MYRPLQFEKRSQLFIGTHNEPLSVVVSHHNCTFNKRAQAQRRNAD